jgi:protein-tyrosine-phosphatase
MKESMGAIKNVLFVCTGNSCRSAMAEALMKKYLKELGKDDIKVSSAGIAAIDGFPPTDETVKVLSEEGMDITGHRTRKLDENIVKAADLILVMEEMHRGFIDSTYPEGSYKTYLLKEYGVDDDPNYPESKEISDPITKPIEYYRLSLQIIRDQVRRIAKLL